jgi:DNA-binding XRE family transcriptional regulator
MKDIKVKLPRQMPGGVKTNKHPLLWLIDNKLGERSKRQLAIAIGVRAQTLYGWERKAEAEPRHFLLPGPRARQIAAYFKVPPELLRPDLWGA